MILLHIAGQYWLDWHLHPEVVFPLVVLEVAYLYSVTEVRGMISDAGRVKRSQVIAFSLGVLVLYIAAGTPVHDISEQYLFSVHMVQHLLFTMVAAPLLLVGTPAWLWQALLRRPGVMPVARLLTNPLVAFSAFNAVLLVTHLPSVVDLALRHHEVHLLVHFVLVVTALMMWWPILSTVPELPRLSYPLQMAYLFLQSLLPAVLASFITFSEGAVYEFYAAAPRIWGISAVTDQQIAGGIMKLVGSLILWGFIGVAFFRWYQREQQMSGSPGWPEVEAELDRLGLNPKP
ncbi:MAG TPA: cytochrome c oxidase assembly protein [Dehalococcoidia bacterium]|nr:cytochrome c oxidase assembly protein [Dehalococcoidia bacterium]